MRTICNSIIFILSLPFLNACMDKSESIIDTDSVIEDGNYRNRDDSIDLRTTFSVLDLSNKVIGLFDKKTEINQFLVNHYMKNINSCRMTEMFGSTKFERTDTLFYGKIHQPLYFWSIGMFYEYHHYFYQNFDVNGIYKDIPQKILHLKDWYIGNNQILRGYFDTDNECDSSIFATIYSFNPELFKPYYLTEFKNKSPEQVSEMLSLTPFRQYNKIVGHNYADGIYQSWIDPKYASDGDTLKYIVWMIDNDQFIELLYKQTEKDSLIMVGGDWFKTTINLEIDW